MYISPEFEIQNAPNPDQNNSPLLINHPKLPFSYIYQRNYNP